MVGPEPRLIMIMGLPGTGKTYFAKALAHHIGAAHINSDRVRKELEKKPSYSEKDRASIYEEMQMRVQKALREKMTVIVDATFSKKSYRQPYFEIANEFDIPIKQILLQADESLIMERVSKKRPDSDADFEVYQKLKSEYEALEGVYLEIRSGKDNLDSMLIQALDHIDSEGIEDDL